MKPTRTDLLEAAYIKSVLNVAPIEDDRRSEEARRAFAAYGPKRPAEQLELPPPWELHVDQRISRDALARRQANAEDLPTYTKVEEAQAATEIASAIVWVAFPLMAVVLALALAWSTP